MRTNTYKYLVACHRRGCVAVTRWMQRSKVDAWNLVIPAMLLLWKLTWHVQQFGKNPWGCFDLYGQNLYNFVISAFNQSWFECWNSSNAEAANSRPTQEGSDWTVDPGPNRGRSSKRWEKMRLHLRTLLWFYCIWFQQIAMIPCKTWKEHVCNVQVIRKAKALMSIQ